MREKNMHDMYDLNADCYVYQKYIFTKKVNLTENLMAFYWTARQSHLCIRTDAEGEFRFSILYVIPNTILVTVRNGAEKT